MKYLFAKRLAFILIVIMMALVLTCASAESWILVDNAELRVEVKSFGQDPIWGHTMKVYLENKTDKLLMYSIDGCVINGVMNDPFWAKEMMAGSKANTEISWFDTNGNIEEVGITRLDFTFKVYDSEDWMADALLNQSYTIYPQGEENVVMSEFVPEADDIVLFDNDEAMMIVTGFREDELWGYTVDAFIKNKTESKLMFSVDNATVNGFMCDPFWASEVAANASAYVGISWLKEDFEMNEITNVEEIVLAVTVNDSEDWLASPVIDQQFTLNP